MPKNYTGSKKNKIPDWYVITGGPSSGKTAVIDKLSKLGFVIFPDAARILIDNEIKKGKSIKKIRENEGEFQRKVLKVKINIERKAPRNKIVFFDRAIPCSAAYYQTSGLDPKEVLKFCRVRKYRKVFFLEQLSFKKDYARTEDSKTVERLNKLLIKGYRNLGYRIIKISVLSIEKRVQKILNEIKRLA